MNARSADGDIDTAFGISLDVNGDGYGDLAVSGINASGDAVVDVFFGGASGLSTTPSQSLVGAGSIGIGAQISAAGDTNGDGFCDLLATAHDETSGANYVYVYQGGPDGLASGRFATIEAEPEAGDTFGFAVAGAGDVNRDGYGDIVIGTQEDNAFVFYGGETGVSSVDPVLLEGAVDSRFGETVSTAGDVNADGYADVLVAAYEGAGGDGSVAIYHRGSAGLRPTSQAGLRGPVGAGGYFGRAAGPAGDVNGDGYADVLVGAPILHFDGGAFLFLGGPVTVSTTAQQVGPTASFATYGDAVAGAGDVDGDGFADVVVSATGISTLYVYRGGPAGLRSAPHVEYEGPAGSLLAEALATNRDFDADGFSDVVGMSRARRELYVFMGNAAGATAPDAIFTRAGGTFGIVVASLVFGNQRDRSGFGCRVTPRAAARARSQG